MQQQKNTDLVELTAQGDKEAFSALFLQYRDKIYTLAFNLTRSYAIAEDILQEVFLKIWIKRAQLTGIENFHGYLIVVTRRVIINELRRISRLRNKESRVESLVSDDYMEDRLQEKQYAELINKGIKQLPGQQATAFTLVKLEGHSREQAAQLMNVSIETVKTHLERATRNLRAFLLSHIDDPLLWVIISMTI